MNNILWSVYKKLQHKALHFSFNCETHNSFIEVEAKVDYYTKNTPEEALNVTRCAGHPILTTEVTVTGIHTSKLSNGSMEGPRHPLLLLGPCVLPGSWSGLHTLATHC